MTTKYLQVREDLLSYISSTSKVSGEEAALNQKAKSEGLTPEERDRKDELHGARIVRLMTLKQMLDQRLEMVAEELTRQLEVTH